jgi:hypothetical protein
MKRGTLLFFPAVFLVLLEVTALWKLNPVLPGSDETKLLNGLGISLQAPERSLAV